jgi:hypothetical protein
MLFSRAALAGSDGAVPRSIDEAGDRTAQGRGYWQRVDIEGGRRRVGLGHEKGEGSSLSLGVARGGGVLVGSRAAGNHSRDLHRRRRRFVGVEAERSKLEQDGVQDGQDGYDAPIRRLVTRVCPFLRVESMGGRAQDRAKTRRPAEA